MWPFRDKDIDTLIFEHAEYKRPSVERALLRRLLAVELFSPIIAGGRDVPSGTTYTIGPDDNIQMAISVIQGQTFAAFYTRKGDPRLGPRFFSMPGRKAMECAVQIHAGPSGSSGSGSSV